MSNINVDQLFLKAKKSLQNNNISGAKEFYQKILQNFPSNTKAQYALSNINKVFLASTEKNILNNYKQGYFIEVVNQTEKLIKSYPNYFMFWKILGLANLNLNNLKNAEIAMRKANSLKANDSSILGNLSLICSKQNNWSESNSFAKSVLKINPDYAEAYFLIASNLENQDQLDEAISFYKKAVLLKSNYFQAYHNLGNIFSKKGELNEGIKNYLKAIDINPKFVDSYFCLGLNYHEKLDHKKAITYYIKSNLLKPNLDECLYMISLASKNLIFKTVNTDLYQAFLSMLEKETLIRPAHITKAALSLIKQQPAVKKILENKNTFYYKRFYLNIISDLSKEKLLTKLMIVSKIPDLDFEKIFKKIRTVILENIYIVPSSDNFLTFQGYLALHCFMNEYIYSETNEESKKIKLLEKSIQDKFRDGKQPPLLSILCLASYRYLHNYSWCKLIIFPNSYKKIEKILIDDFKTENELLLNIPSFSKIDNEVSVKVKKQYEENPYPRWVSTPLSIKPSNIYEIVQKSNLRIADKNIISVKCPEIFIAGCGTGQQSISASSRYKNSKIIAIDLSIKSLAYAKRKTIELGLNNIEYKQGDILNLPKNNKKFDIIECTGVLHHLHKPMTGWEALVDLLKVGGLMLIALYSKNAREDIALIRKEIEDYGIHNDETGMKLFRNKIINSDKPHHRRIVVSQDFYSSSDFRDLLFHEQEYHFTLKEIKQCLSLLNLEFCGFESLDNKSIFKEKTLGGNDLYDLDKWHDFEQKNRSYFSGMYQFWCQKK